jgi:hypothetical protein
VPERVLVSAPDKVQGARNTEAWSGGAAVKALGWFGVILALAALSDFVLAFYPLGFGSAEWELATISSVIQGLPLISIGLAAIWVSGGLSGQRRLLIAVGVLLLASAVSVFGLLIVFLTNVPIALQATRDVARLGIEKLAAKTVVLALVFGVSYIVAGVLALKQARGVIQKGAVA